MDNETGLTPELCVSCEATGARVGVWDGAGDNSGVSECFGVSAGTASDDGIGSAVSGGFCVDVSIGVFSVPHENNTDDITDSVRKKTAFLFISAPFHPQTLFNNKNRAFAQI